MSNPAENTGQQQSLAKQLSSLNLKRQLVAQALDVWALDTRGRTETKWSPDRLVTTSAAIKNHKIWRKFFIRFP